MHPCADLTLPITLLALLNQLVFILELNGQLAKLI